MIVKCDCGNEVFGEDDVNVFTGDTFSYGEVLVQIICPNCKDTVFESNSWVTNPETD